MHIDNPDLEELLSKPVVLVFHLRVGPCQCMECRKLFHFKLSTELKWWPLIGWLHKNHKKIIFAIFFLCFWSQSHLYCIYLVSLSWETNNSFCSDPSRAWGHADHPGILRAATESEISLWGVNKVGGHKKKKNLCFLQSKMWKVRGRILYTFFPRFSFKLCFFMYAHFS